MHDNLHCYTALAGKDFDALIDSSETNRRRAISQREIILLSPPPTQCPDGLWRVGEFRWFDVALKITSDLLSARRYRRGVTIALPILQMKLIEQIDRDADVWVGLVERYRNEDDTHEIFELLAGTPSEIKGMAKFLDLPGTAHAWFVSLRRVKEIMRERAENLGLKMPSRLTLEGDEARAEIIRVLKERQAKEARAGDLRTKSFAPA
jgi:hypothetical protein